MQLEHMHQTQPRAARHWKLASLWGDASLQLDRNWNAWDTSTSAWTVCLEAWANRSFRPPARPPNTIRWYTSWNYCKQRYWTLYGKVWNSIEHHETYEATSIINPKTMGSTNIYMLGQCHVLYDSGLCNIIVSQQVVQQSIYWSKSALMINNVMLMVLLLMLL